LPILRWLSLLFALPVAFQAAIAGPSLRSVLSKFPTVAGVSLWTRIHNCNIHVQQRNSRVEEIFSDHREIDLLKGDMAVDLFVDLPKPSGSAWASSDGSQFKDIPIQWTIRKGIAIPTTGWAENLLKSKPPLMWLNC